MRRREFLRIGGCWVAATVEAGLLNALACARPDRSYPPAQALLSTGPIHRPDSYGDIGYDAAPAINEAIDECSRVGGRVLLSPGVTYPYRTRIHLRRRGPHRVQLEGEGTTRDGGPAAILQKAVSLAEATLNVESDAVISNLHIRGPFVGRRPEAGNGVNGGERDGWGIYDCLIEGFEYNGVNSGDDCGGVAIVRTTLRRNGGGGIQIGWRCERFLVQANEVYENQSNGIDCNGSWNRIYSNDCYANGRLGRGTDRQGIHLFAAPGTSVSGNEVFDNDCYDNPRHGIVLTSPEGTMRGNVIAGNRCRDQISGIWIEGGARHTGNLVQGNILESNRGYGLGWGTGPSFGEFEDIEVRENVFNRNGEGATWCHPGASFLGNTRNGRPYHPCG